jgi:hypothetical protein
MAKKKWKEQKKMKKKQSKILSIKKGIKKRLVSIILNKWKSNKNKKDIKSNKTRKTYLK